MNWRLLFEIKTIMRPGLLPKSTARVASKEGRRQPRANCSMCGWSLWVWMGSVLSFFAVSLVYGNVSAFAPAFLRVPIFTFTMASVWLQLLLIPIICVLIVTLYTFLADELAPFVMQLAVEESFLDTFSGSFTCRSGSKGVAGQRGTNSSFRYYGETGGRGRKIIRDKSATERPSKLKSISVI